MRHYHVRTAGDPGHRRRRPAWARCALLAAAVTAASASGLADAARAQSGPGAAVLTHRNDAARTGANLQERALTVESLSSGQFRKLYSLPVIGQVYGQPLYVPGMTWSDGKLRNVVFVATMENMVFAYDTDEPLRDPLTRPLWSVLLGQPIDYNYMPMRYSTPINIFFCGGLVTLAGSVPPCVTAQIPSPATDPPAVAVTVEQGGWYNVWPKIGITSTPVIDLPSQTLFVVAKVRRIDQSIAYTLHALDLVTGQQKPNSPVTITGSAAGSVAGVPTTVQFDAQKHLQRPALLLQGGHLYAGFGSHQDTRPYHGWIFRFDPATLARTAVWCTTPNGEDGGIWQAGSGLAGGSDGTVYVMTGNGTTDPARSNFATAFVQLGPALDVRSFFVPPNAARLNELDADLGAAGPVLLPGTNIAIGAGKEGVMHVLDRNGMGMRQLFQVTHALDNPSYHGSGYHHLHGSPVVWRSDDSGLRAYLWGERDKMRAFQWRDGTAVFDTSPVQISTIESPSGITPSMPGGILSVSANGGRRGSGLLWASLPKSQDALHAVVPGILRVFDAADITRELWNSERNPAQDNSGLFAKYAPPTVADGRVFLATFSNRLDVYGLRQWATLQAQTQPPPQMGPGQTFTMEVTLRNTGATTWTPQAGYALGSESPRDNVVFGTNRQPLPRAVAPGETVTIPVPLTAPRQAGGFPVQWRMVQDGVEWFGEASQPAMVIVMLAPMTIHIQQGLEGTRNGFIIVTANDGRTGAPLSGGNVTMNGRTGTLGSRIVFPLCFETIDTAGRPTRVQVECEGFVDVAGYQPAPLSVMPK